MPNERENDESAVEKRDRSGASFDRVPKKATARVWRLHVDFLKIIFQATLVGLVITPIIVGRLQFWVFAPSAMICLLIWIISTIIEWRLKEVK